MSGGEEDEAVNPCANMDWMTSDGVNSTHKMPGPRGPKPALNSEQIACLVELAGEGAKKPVTRDKTMLEGLI